MEEGENFIRVAGLICEPSRARILWNLLDGKAYTATELAVAADISFSSASNHLSKLLKANIIKFETQGRHRYFSFLDSETAYAVEALATLANTNSSGKVKKEKPRNGIRYCRTCYDHLAGFVGVKFAEAFERKEFLHKTETAYEVTEKGWEWFAEFGIFQSDFAGNRRPLTRQCLDWSERRPHLAGQLGATFLEKLFQKKWFKKVQFSRELIITSKGFQEIYQSLELDLRQST
ncbi:MAG: helix-turn-helix transcriptional regulator [Blastocatellia bacterium]|nr:helix-turn-helix transcriptional regulator [Blastocatellia bacterium]